MSKSLHEDMATLCSIFACDRAAPSQAISLPRPGSPQCDAVFLATWQVFRHVTTRIGKQRMLDLGQRRPAALEAFVQGQQVPAYLRWAEAEALIRAGEWRGDSGTRL